MPGSRLLAMLVMSIASFGAIAPHASAAPPKRPTREPLNVKVVTKNSQAPVSDGRYVALWQLTPPVADPTVYRVSYLAAIRDDQTGALTAVRPGCRLISPEGGYAGELCADGIWRVIALRSGARADIPLGDLITAPGAVSQVGHDWAFWSSNYGPSAYVNWRTGERIVARSSQADPTFDLNTASGRRLPLVHGTVVQGRSSSQVFPLYPDTPLRALRLKVGGRVRTVRSRCTGNGCSSISYSNGVLSWYEGGDGNKRTDDDSANAYIVASNRLLTWNAAQGGSSYLEYPVNVTHTARRVYLDGSDGVSSAASTYQLEAALPAPPR